MYCYPYFTYSAKFGGIHLTRVHRHQRVSLGLMWLLKNCNQRFNIPANDSRILQFRDLTQTSWILAPHKHRLHFVGALLLLAESPLPKLRMLQIRATILGCHAMKRAYATTKRAAVCGFVCCCCCCGSWANFCAVLIAHTFCSFWKVWLWPPACLPEYYYFDCAMLWIKRSFATFSYFFGEKVASCWNQDFDS